MRTGGDRARMAAQQLARLVARSAQRRIDQIALVAEDDLVRDYVQHPVGAQIGVVRARLQSLAPSMPYRITLWNVAGTRLLEIAGPGGPASEAASLIFPREQTPGRIGVNAFTTARDSVFSRNVAAIHADHGGAATSSEDDVLGHVVVRALVANPHGSLAVNAGDVVARLVGTEATLAIGNTAGEAWTDLGKKVPAPPAEVTLERAVE